MKTNSTLSRKFALFFVAIAIFCGTTATAQTFTIIDESTTEPPGGAAGADANIFDGPVGAGGIETGIRFQVTQAGTVDAISFFKGTTNTGTHIGTIWNDATGVSLGQVTFTGETADGWQTMAFSPAITLAPGVTYTASIHSSTGVYAGTGGVLGADDITAIAPFILIGSSTSSVANDPTPRNGVFEYSTTPIRPDNNGNTAIYWVNVTFTTFFPLPVTLSEFKATASNNNVNLDWKTEMELNNQGFEIQRSNNGRDWYALDFVKGVGESSITRSYNFIDKALAPGTYYYRLKQVDQDSKSTFSSIQSVRIAGSGRAALQINGLNPFSGSTRLRIDLPSSQLIRLSVVDLSGREVKVLINGSTESGSHIVTLDAAGLSPQMYVVRLRTEEGVLTQKIVVK